MTSPRYDATHKRFITTLGELGAHPNTAILNELTAGPRRFNELLAEATVSEAALTASLRELDGDGLVYRHVDPGPPLRVLYELTPLGAKLAPAFGALGQLAIEETALSGL